MNYLELQILDKKDFKVLSPYASYSSKLTGVCSFSADSVSLINQRFPNLLEKYKNQENNDLFEEIPSARVVVKNNKIFIENGNIEMLTYLDTRSLLNPEVKIINLPKLFDVIEAGLVETSEDFDALMTPLTEDSLISELYTSNGRMNFRGVAWSLTKLGEDKKVGDLHFDEAPRLYKRMMTLKNMKIISYNAETKICHITDQKGYKKYEMKFFYVTPNLSSVLKEGRIVTVASKKAYGEAKEGEEVSYKLIEPIIIPTGLELKSIENLKSPRSIPVAIYNSAYAEFKYRSKDKEA